MRYIIFCFTYLLYLRPALFYAVQNSANQDETGMHTAMQSMCVDGWVLVQPELRISVYQLRRLVRR